MCCAEAKEVSLQSLPQLTLSHWASGRAALPTPPMRDDGVHLSGQEGVTCLHLTHTHHERTRQEPSLSYVSTNSTSNMRRHPQLFPPCLFSLSSHLHWWCMDIKPMSRICAGLRFHQIHRTTDVAQFQWAQQMSVTNLSWHCFHFLVGSHDVWTTTSHYMKSRSALWPMSLNANLKKMQNVSLLMKKW